MFNEFGSIANFYYIYVVGFLYNFLSSMGSPPNGIPVHVDLMSSRDMTSNSELRRRSCLGFQGISGDSSDGELATNVAKTHTGAENHTGNPGAYRDALLGNFCTQRILPASTIEKCSPDRRAC